MTKKSLIIVGAIIAFVAGFALIKQFKKTKASDSYEIGILQTASHPALDAARDGFTEQLKTHLKDKISFVVQNAQGNISQAHAIAQQLQSNKELDAFYAIATPAAQAMAAVEKTKPIIISAVTDPKALGLIHSKTNVTGVTDMINVAATIDMIIQLTPQAKNIGLLYTSGETNSIVLADAMRSEIERRGLTATDFAVSNESDMQAAVNLACRKSDALLAPTDNVVAASISLITSITQKHSTPLYVSDNMLVQYGALAARGVDYRECGKQAGDMTYKLLTQDIAPYNLAVEQPKSETIYLNSQIAQNLGVTIPQALEKDIHRV